MRVDLAQLCANETEGKPGIMSKKSVMGTVRPGFSFIEAILSRSDGLRFREVFAKSQRLF
jgi:hypothetical protein